MGGTSSSDTSRECQVPKNKASEAGHVGRGWQEDPVARLPVKTKAGGLGERPPPSETSSRGPLRTSLGHGSVHLGPSKRFTLESWKARSLNYSKGIPQSLEKKVFCRGTNLSFPETPDRRLAQVKKMHPHSHL